MANLTLSIDDKLLQAARLRAVKEGTSVNEVCRQALEAYARPGGQSRLARYMEVRALIDAAGPPVSADAADTSARDNFYDEVLRTRHPTLMASLTRHRGIR